ncbi:hypothetical protein VSDG_01984 [Cytospora chrysosperma]|uniref:Uncharacterized protein n=1 Tax=Cytospora chrysosperma TaxID=252740 RepID=A0A423WE92_CYTCH|nr:hypothetical protein VSDG_01984 [Valsa sordida]
MAGKESRRTPAADVHASFNLVSGKTMRCDFCNARNTAVLKECRDCQLHICSLCAYQGRLNSDPKHHLVLDADSDDDARNLNGGDPSRTDPGRRVEVETGGIPQPPSTVVATLPRVANPSIQFCLLGVILVIVTEVPFLQEMMVPIGRQATTVTNKILASLELILTNLPTESIPLANTKPTLRKMTPANSMEGMHVGVPPDTMEPLKSMHPRASVSITRCLLITHRQHPILIITVASLGTAQMPQRAQAANPNSVVRMQDYPLASTPEQYSRSPPPALGPYIGPPQAPFLHSPASPAFDPSPGVGVGGSHGVAHGVPEGLDHPIGGPPPAEVDAAILHAYRVNMGRVAADRHTQEMEYYAQLAAARAHARQRLEEYMPEYYPLPAYPPPGYPPPPVYQPHPPESFLQNAASGYVGDSPERYAQRRHRPNGSDTAAAMQDEHPRLPRTPEGAANRHRTSSSLEPQVRIPANPRSHAPRDAAAAAAAATQEERPREAADNQEGEVAAASTDMDPNQEVEIGAPDAQGQAIAVTESIGGRVVDRPQPGRRLPRFPTWRAASSGGPSSEFRGRRTNCSTKRFFQSLSSSSSSSSLSSSEGEGDTAPTNYNTNNANNNQTTTPVPGSEQMQEVLSSNPILRRVRRQEGEMAALEMMRGANTMVEMAALERERARDGRRGLGGRELLPMTRANQLETERRREEVAPRRRGGQRRERKRQKM